MSTHGPDVTIRRILQQTLHCVQEAHDVIVHEEAIASAILDLEQAQLLLERLLPELRRHKGHLDAANRQTMSASVIMTP